MRADQSSAHFVRRLDRRISFGRIRFETRPLFTIEVRGLSPDSISLQNNRQWSGLRAVCTCRPH
jgi:hypothetical protein